MPMLIQISLFLLLDFHFHHFIIFLVIRAIIIRPILASHEQHAMCLITKPKIIFILYLHKYENVDELLRVNVYVYVRGLPNIALR